MFEHGLQQVALSGSKQAIIRLSIITIPACNFCTFTRSIMLGAPTFSEKSLDFLIVIFVLFCWRQKIQGH